MKNKTLSPYKIAELCHSPISTVFVWIEKGELQATREGEEHLVQARDLVVFLRKKGLPIPKELEDCQPLQILIVDDEEPIRMMVRRVIQKNYPHAEIHEAADGFQAGMRIAQVAPRLVILDLKLPGIDGLRVSQIVESDTSLKATKILAISGFHPEESRKKSLAMGADDFLGKPFSVQSLKSKVSKLLNEP